MGFVVPRALFAVLLVGACGRTDLLPPARPTPSSPPIDCTGSDTQTDARNCGACGNVCSVKAPSTARCTLGRCVVTLAAGGVYADFVVGASHVYWTNWGGGTLMKLAKGGGKPVELASVAGSANGLAIDATHLYWTTYDLDGTVAKTSLDGGRPTT